LGSEQAELIDKINANPELNDEVEAALSSALDAFKANSVW
jgi:hypothetical protein